MEHVLTPLCELAKKFGTDKGGWHLIAGETCHNYCPTYHRLLGDRRETIKAVLEIGVNYGGSLRMWEEYFPNARVVGLDSNAGCLFNEGRISCFAADQGSGESLEAALNLAAIPQYDLIVDDGSHEPNHQIFSANALQHRLAPNGLYIIEDIFPDCKPELILNHIGWGKWTAEDCGMGLGKAVCGCGGDYERVHSEVLLVGRHG